MMMSKYYMMKNQHKNSMVNNDLETSLCVYV
jgi:poly(3-hydroxyalkanoate) synthetase